MSPRYARRTASSANTSSVGPDAISVPKSSTNTPLDEAAHELDVVLDEQDRDPALAVCTARSCSAERLGLVAVEARRRLVEQQQLRLGHQRAPDLDQAADAEAQRLDRAVGDGIEPEQRRASRRRASCSSAFGPPRNEQVLPQRAAPVAHALGDEEVLARRHPREQLDALERAADAEPGALVGRRRG